MADEALPPNWRKASDSDGKAYYFNELTGETSWDFPGEDGASAGGRETSSGVAVDPVAGAATSRVSEMPGAMADPEAPAFVTTKQSRAVAGGDSSLEQLLGEGGLQRIVIIAFCSCVVLIASAIELDRKGSISSLAGVTIDGTAESYGVAVGCISLASTAPYMWLAKKRPDTFANWTLPKVKGDLSVAQCYAIFLVLWWLPAAAVLTFFSPFLTTSNGYFAVWAAFAASMLSLGAAFTSVATRFRSMSTLHQDANTNFLLGLGLSSAVVFFASIEFTNTSEGTFGLVAGILTATICALLAVLVNRKKVGPKPKKVAAFVLLALWLSAACVLTFDGPFNRTGNGYFGTLFATFCALSFAYEEMMGTQMPLAAGVRRSFKFTSMEEESASTETAPQASIGNISNVA